MRSIYLILVIFGGCFAQDEVAKDCYLIGKPARVPPVGLGFCALIFPFENCCIPAYDEEIKEEFDTLMGVSELCAATMTESKRALQYLFCFGCANDQPNYLTTVGTMVDDDGEYTLYEISICDDLAKQLYPENFDKCGLLIPGERGNICADDDTVIPSQHWGRGEEGVLNFLNDDVGGKPPLFANSSEERFVVKIAKDNMNCYKSSAALMRVSWLTIGLTIFVALSCHWAL